MIGKIVQVKGLMHWRVITLLYAPADNYSAFFSAECGVNES